MSLFALSDSAKAFFYLFLLLAVAALAHDIYIWNEAGDRPFAFAALGWSFKIYLPEAYLMTVDTLGNELFDTILTPILKIPAAFLFAGCAAFVFTLNILVNIVKSARMSKEPPSRYSRTQRHR